VNHSSPSEQEKGIRTHVSSLAILYYGRIETKVKPSRSVLAGRDLFACLPPERRWFA